MVADTKKVQTLINRMADAIEAGREAEVIKDAYTAANPSVVGTPLEGNLPAVNTWLTGFIAVLNDPVAQAFIDEKVPTHSGDAL